MNFSYYDLKHLERGQIVEVTLSAAANVRLMDASNYSNYKNGRKHHDARASFLEPEYLSEAG